ncbi:RagB/SusD family nutrient uptake outer membrane protein [Sphingobacterium sp. SGG-5]|uniref:RagB/SusD family nutrient uptake outer membrane protein n=1 Tax=Sphingobacterium sp. SGG-5 TaxID=2710881 RepID=UPI0013EC6BC4|nr:RagB/SusD family nutrient uptake outer membrane protein [Sphingobacterium sp. SGG-5]NGM62679.1 RagB/SusD family nutrient uptake outer membrane protein [Sphingobacterium sp. SGG-5]
MNYIKTAVLILFFSCKGDLDIKPDQGLLIPTKLEDMQALLDNVEMNRAPGLHMIAGEEYAITTEGVTSLRTAPERNSYLWADDVYEGSVPSDWRILYEQVFYANVVLDGLNTIEVTEENRSVWNQLKGSALFFRSLAFYQLIVEYAMPYEKGSADKVPGIPLKLSSDINEKVERVSIRDCFKKILSDLDEAGPLLETVQSVYLTRPSRHAVYALLARIALYMQEYGTAEKYADRCITLSPGLMDYNGLSRTSSRPISFAQAGEEVIFPQFMLTYSFATSSRAGISEDLLSVYETGDLRRIIFFRDRGNGVFTFKGNYSGTSSMFLGTTTAEMYLIRSECRARLDDIEGALADVNHLRKMRWDSNVPYQDVSMEDREEVIRFILLERRKELAMRGLRWSDLKRLNRDSRFETTLERTAYDRTHILAPQSDRYAFPIPQIEVDINNLAQNKRD